MSERGLLGRYDLVLHSRLLLGRCGLALYFGLLLRHEGIVLRISLLTCTIAGRIRLLLLGKEDT